MPDNNNVHDTSGSTKPDAADELTDFDLDAVAGGTDDDDPSLLEKAAAFVGDAWGSFMEGVSDGRGR